MIIITIYNLINVKCEYKILKFVFLLTNCYSTAGEDVYRVKARLAVRRVR